MTERDGEKLCYFDDRFHPSRRGYSSPGWFSDLLGLECCMSVRPSYSRAGPNKGQTWAQMITVGNKKKVEKVIKFCSKICFVIP